MIGRGEQNRTVIEQLINYGLGFLVLKELRQMSYLPGCN
jgi:hypothetical protein